MTYRAAQYARDLTYWRGLTQVAGPLAGAYEHEGDLRNTLHKNRSTTVYVPNLQIWDELWFVPQGSDNERPR